MDAVHIFITILLVVLIIVCLTNYTHPIQQIDTFNSMGNSYKRYGCRFNEYCPRNYMCRNFQPKNLFI